MWLASARSMMMLLLFHLFSLSQATICSYNVDCQVAFTRETFGVPSTIHVDHHLAQPTGLSSYHIIKTNGSSGMLYLESTLKWSLISWSNTPSEPITGFGIILESLNDPSLSKFSFRATLGKPLDMKQGYSEEFFLALDGVLSFGVNYKFEVIILPTAAGNAHSTEFATPPILSNSARCNPQKESEMRSLAALWSTDFFSVRTLEALPAVNVTFYPAPDVLCIDAYDLQLMEEDGKVLRKVVLYQNSSYVQEEASPLFLSYIFYDLPLDQRLVVKVGPRMHDERGRCVCDACNCMSVRSNVIHTTGFMPKMNLTQPIHAPPRTDEVHYSATEKKIGIFLVGGFLVLLACCIALMTMLRSRRFQDKEKIILRNGRRAQILLEEGQKPQPFGFRQVLIVASHDDQLESRLVDELSCIVTLQPFTVVYMDKKEKHVVERNYQSWVHSKVEAADKIVVVHSRTAMHSLRKIQPTGLCCVFRTLVASLNPLDVRLVHVKLEEKSPLLLPSVETCFLLPRDRSFLMQALQLPYTEVHWRRFQELTKRRIEGEGEEKAEGKIIEWREKSSEPLVTVEDEGTCDEDEGLLSSSVSVSTEPPASPCLDEDEGVYGCDSGIALSCEGDSFSKHSS